MDKVVKILLYLSCFLEDCFVGYWYIVYFIINKMVDVILIFLIWNNIKFFLIIEFFFFGIFVFKYFDFLWC